MSSQPSLSKSQNNQVRVDDHTQHAAQPRGTEGVYSPRVDIVETNDAVHMYALMPGVRPENVSLHCNGGQLVLHGRCLPRGLDKRLVHQEYGVGDFYRTFTLTELVDQAKIQAHIDNGVLSITLPKVESAKPRRIVVSGK
jgi:HSP20 family protein